MFVGPALYALLLGAGVPAWYAPWSNPHLAHDRMLCSEDYSQSLDSCSTVPPHAEASQESYFEQSRDTRTSWWLQSSRESRNTESAE